MPALHLFGKRTLLGGDDLHVPALVTTIVRGIQLSFFVLPLGIFIWKQALTLTTEESNASESSRTSSFEWPIWRYLFDWWGEVEAIAAKANNNSNNNDYEGLPKCAESVLARYYPLLSTLHLLGTVLFCGHSLVLEYRIWHWSCQGTPTMRQPRTRHVQELLQKKLGICTMLLALMVTSTYLVATLMFARPYHNCFHTILNSYNHDGNVNGMDDDNNADDFVDGTSNQGGMDRWVPSKSWYALGALLAISQTAEVVFAALFYIRLKNSNDNPTPSGVVVASNQNSGHSNRTVNAFHHELTEELWADRCESLFRCLSISTCFLFGGRDLVDNAKRNSAYNHVAQALADYLETKGTLDVVPTDLFTGLFVLQRIQKQRILQTRKSVFEESFSLRASIVGERARTAPPPSSAPPISETLSSERVSTAPPSICALPNPGAHATLSPARTDNHYHRIVSPEIEFSKTGLRSRVASSNDFWGRTAGTTPIKMSHGNLPVIPQLAPPSQHLQMIQGLRQNQQGQRNIYRRNHSSVTAEADPLLAANSSGGNEGPFYRTTSRQVLDPSNPNDASTLEEAAQMCKYALSIYTWMLYVFVHPISGLPRLVCQCGKTKRGMADCCCKLCDVLKDRNNNISRSPSSSGASTPLRRRRESSTATNGNYDTNQQREPLHLPSGAASTNPLSDSRMAISRHSSEGSIESFETAMEMGDQFRQEIGEGYYDCDQFSCEYSNTSGDNFGEWHKRALLLVAGIPEADLVYAEFNNKLSTVPYCILLDHERSLVVLSIRGSLSLEDIVTDVSVLPESLEDVGKKYGFDGRGQYCHAGVLACFENVMRDLERHCWLERLLEQQHPEYSLRIVGHSLGAGVSTVLGYVLRSKYPSLKVFGYSPPGCTMTWDMAIGCHDFTTSFVLDSDIVPRLSVLALEDLRDEVLELIGRIKVPKYKVYQNFFKARERRRNRSCLFGNTYNDSSSHTEDYNLEDDLDELTHTINETLDVAPSDTTYQRQMMDFRRVQDERKQARGETNSKSLRLYPPGKMIHLVRTGEESGCSHCLNQCLTCWTSNSGFVYTPMYISNDDLDEIVVTATMGTDHFIDRMCDELHTLSERYGPEITTNCGVATAYPCSIRSGSIEYNA